MTEVNVAAVVRAIKNPKIESVVKQLLDMGVGLCIVVTDKRKDRNYTPRALSSIDSDRLRVIRMGDYSWVNALNRGITCVLEENQSRPQRLRYILNISCEVQLLPNQLRKMVAAIEKPNIGVVGVTISAHLDGKCIPLDRMYNRHPRNTCSLWRVDILDELGMFDTRTDEYGGLEDLYLLILMEMETRNKFEMLGLFVDLEIGANYNHSQQEAREGMAADRIVTGFRERYAHSDGRQSLLNGILASRVFYVPYGRNALLREISRDHGGESSDC